MTGPVARIVDMSHGDRRWQAVWTWCPGCESLHPFNLAPGDSRGVYWQWDGDLERPTFSPSMLVHWSVHLCAGEHGPVPCPNPDSCGQPGHMILDGDVRAHGTPHTRAEPFGHCHSFLRAGRWEFLSDSAHALAGQTVDMVPLPRGWRADPEEEL